VVELGRHTILRGWRARARAGSSPAFGTRKIHNAPGLMSGFFVLSQIAERPTIIGRPADDFRKGSVMVKTIKILSWNVNGIRALHKKGFLEWLDTACPDILCLQETKALPEQLPEALCKPPGYFAHWHYAQKKGYSGVAVFTRQKPRRVQNGMGFPHFDEEGRFIQVDFEDFTLFNVYFPNGKKGPERLQFKMAFYDAFLEYLERLRKTSHRLMFLGDINTAHREIDIARPKENSTISGFLPIEREWIDKVVSLGYVDTFRHFHEDEVQYSWWDMKSRARERNVGWRIDSVFVTREMLADVKSAFILGDVMGSDHCPVGVELAESQVR
jgi:exodeoxyribonuclease III